MKVDQIRTARNLQSFVSIILHFYLIVVSIVMQPLFAIDYSLLDALVEAIQAHVVAKEYVIVRSRLKDRVQS
jgi:hypothetical protein